MKCVILAGGKGFRIFEYTKKIPKPMIKVAGKPIICHIINHYVKYGFKDFIIAAGYKKEIIKNFFEKNQFPELKIKIVNTGVNTMTGGRLKKLKKFLNNETFMMTYGDGISNINLKKLLKFHKKHKKIATLTSVRPPFRFGSIKISKNNHVKYFKEKSKLDSGWINGGFFVFEPKIFDYIKNDQTLLEEEPLQKISKRKQLFAYKHNGYWQCMDTLKDKILIEDRFMKLQST